MKRHRSILKIAAVFMAALLASCLGKTNTVVFEIPDGYRGPLFIIIDKNSPNQIEVKDGKYIVPFNKYGFCVLNKAKYLDSAYQIYVTVGNENPERILLPSPGVNDHGKDVRFYDVYYMDHPLQDGRDVVFMFYGTADEETKFSIYFHSLMGDALLGYFKQKWPEYFDKK
jgi:hypothetical protein